MFPQLRGLGQSAAERKFGMASLEAARTYLGHRVLGPRYRESVGALQDLAGTSAEMVAGSIDAPKLRSPLRLFGEARFRR